jgi:hypothetical protein
VPLSERVLQSVVASMNMEHKKRQAIGDMMRSRIGSPRFLQPAVTAYR